jgi:signal transduction histidine kinase/ligand-binding sensor domain-containing protein
MVSSNDFVVEVWDTDSGLPHSTVTSIAQTPDGYLWIGTLHGGLARFDGTRFSIFHPGNTPELRSIEIHKLLLEPDGTLWIGNVEGGLISYRDGRFRFEYWNNDTPRAWVEEILASRPGQTDFSSRLGLILRRTESGGTNQWKVLASPDAHSASMSTADREGRIWYRTVNGRLGLIEGTNITQLGLPPGLRSAANTLVKDSQGQIWVGTDLGLGLWNGTNFTLMITNEPGRNLAVRQMLPTSDGGFWVMTTNQLRKYLAGQWTVNQKLLGTEGARNDAVNLAGCTLQFTDSQNGAWLWHERKKLIYVTPDGRISLIGDAGGRLAGSLQCWLEDREGNIWIGLNEGGLVRLRPRIFHSVWPANNVDSKAARSVCEDADGAIWFGTGERQVLRWKDGEFNEFLPPLEASSSDMKVFPAGEGGVWVGSVQNGLQRLQEGRFVRPFDSKEIGTVVRCLLRDRKGALWIGSEFGLFRWDDLGLKAFGAADGFAPAYILSLVEDKNGDIWSGTALGGLRCYSAGKFTTFRPADSLTDPATLRAAVTADPMANRNRGALSGGERFWALHADEEGVIWIGTLGGGLLRFKDGKFFRYTTRSGLGNEHISQILEDDRHQLWLGSRAGITRVSRRELNAFAEGGIEQPNFVSYGKADGLPALECSGGAQPACWRDHTGRLWFTTVRGAVWVNPNDLRVNRLAPPVHIEEVLVNGQAITATGQGTLPPRRIDVPAGQHYFELRYTALSFTAPDKVRFRWRLHGAEREWVGGGPERVATFSYLPPGNYQFSVVACNNDGIWTEATAELELIVPPFFWQTWWFKLASALAIAGVLFLYYSVRMDRLRALQRLRLRIARDLHDEVGANLGSVSLLAQMMETNPNAEDARQVRGIVSQTVDTLRDIVWFIDPTHERLSDLVVRLRDTAKHMLSSVAHDFEVQGDFTSVGLPLDLRRNVIPIFKETLHNALKHAHATQIKISIRRTSRGFVLTIVDNGRGFNSAKLHPGNGLRNLRKRAQEMGAQLDVISEAGNGTTVTLTANIP